jgi:hypothetical protein
VNPDELLLREIHLPAPVSWWPPAIGWWLVVAAVIVGVAALTLWWRHRIALRTAPATLARADLARLRATWLQNQDTQWLVSEVSTWLRRVSMSLVSRERAASLTGSHWREYLNELAGEPVFDATDAALITAAPYRANPADAKVNGEHLLILCQRWLDAAARQEQSR